MTSADDAPMKIYAINMDRSRDRWDELCREAADLGIELQRVEALDGATVDEKDRVDWDEPLFKRNTGRWMLPGEYGCYRSHIKALSTFVDSGLQSAIIIEDDIRLVADLPKRAAAALAAVPQADVIKFFNHRMVGFRRYASSEYGDNVGRAIHGPMGSAACYLVTRPGAVKLLGRMRVMEYPYDIALERGWATGTEVFTVEQDVVRSKRPPSTIASRAVYRTKKFVWWKRFPTHFIRARDYLDRLFYALRRP
ncbi:glycosyl transferase family 25 [Pseudorhizobium endolithicum]|uniref:Glycosyl transferase family 25 n=1 Tax=Pseudorhizobium endolithicum TaxID=1191678 RepID=A0ABN7K1W7_9HYPH|nr:glycosyltransferase family 25 protein [Pseudorhizobium endolithicum]CAD7054479.1 glycosyl transferase family 25 [Pseudorhizobium endolithicum]